MKYWTPEVMSETKKYSEVLEKLKETYPSILVRCRDKWPNPHGEITLYDIIHDTIVKLLSDERVSQIEGNEEFIRYFIYRANTTIFQAIHDKRKRQKSYADYQTFATQSSTDEEQDD